MKKKALLLATTAALALCSFSLSSCNKKKNKDVEEETVSVEVYGLQPYYLPTDKIDWDSIYLEVEETYYHHGEFDVTSKSKSETEFTLDTSGLYTYTSNQNTIPEGSYPISYSLEYEGTSYSAKLFTVYVTSNVTSLLQAESFSQPESIITWERNQTRVDTSSSQDESNFIEGKSEYTVGCDNPFIYRPVLEISANDTKNTTDVYAFPKSYAANVTVTLDGTALDVSSNEYVSFDETDFGFQFTEAAIGKTFTLTIAPRDFTSIWGMYVLESQSVTVTVQKGWNVNNAIDLGRINLLSDEYKPYIDYYEYAKPKVNEKEVAGIFWDSSRGYYNEYNYKIWENFLTSKGRDDLTYTSAIYLHDDINVTIDDIPSEFIVSQEEINAQPNPSLYSNDVLNSVKDGVYIYTHYLQGEDFTLDGNLFSIRCSSLKWCMTRVDNEQGDFRYYATNKADRYKMCHAALFSINDVADKSESGLPSALTERYSATFTNIEAHGNQERINPEEATSYDSQLASGCLIFLRSASSNTKVTNVLAKNFLQGYYCCYSDDSYCAFEVDKCKIYDCYGSPFFGYGSSKNKTTNSIMSRFGGPIVVLNSVYGNKFQHCGWEIDECDYESLLIGTEAWFDILGISSVIPFFTDIDNCFTGNGNVFIPGFTSKGYGKSLKNEDGYFDVIGVGNDASSGMIGGEVVDISMTFDGDTYSYSSDEVPSEPDPENFAWVANAYYSDYGTLYVDGGLMCELAGNRLPIFMTNTGKIFGILLSNSRTALVDMVDFYTKYIAIDNEYSNRDKTDANAEEAFWMEHYPEMVDIEFDEDDTSVFGIDITSAMTICLALRLFDYPYAE
ncbi:MAG: hypothetical protein LUC31_02715 [Coprobacillus sp.]|nr:hypothetical protein [Coprobacillus sp.]